MPKAESDVGCWRSEVRIALVEVAVCGDREEGSELLGQYQTIEDFGRIAVASAFRVTEVGQFLVTDPGVAFTRDRLAILGGRPVVDPLPELGTGDLSGGGVLHQ